MTIIAQLTLNQDEKSVTIPLGAEAISQLINQLPDTETMGEVFTILAQHPSAELRSSLARKDHLPDEAVRILAKDSSRNVLNSLLSSAAARNTLTSEELLAMCRLDPEIAGNVACNIESFSSLENDEVLNFIEKHPDPDVRIQLIGNYSVSKRILQRIAKNDPDPELQAKAWIVFSER
jgi:hypothetical protein